MDELFAVVTPGLESIALNEMEGLGLKILKIENGGISFQGDLKDLYRSNLNLRTVSRILIRFGKFHSSAFSELRKKSSRLDWERFLTPGQTVSIRATSHKSRLYHSDAVIERVLGGISDHLGSVSTHIKTSDIEDSGIEQLILVRLVDDECVISIDSSGDLLHRRGYRLETAKAPIRENLAAALVLASGWGKDSPLIDPFCGSGTIPIEAALLALGYPPGLKRNFAFMNWPNFDPILWKQLLSVAQIMASENLPTIYASDRDAGAIKIATANATRIGLENLIQFECKAISAISPTSQPGWIITNPPYGLRVTSNQDLRNLYAQFGNTLRKSFQGWHVTFISSDARLFAQLGFALDTSIKFNNGGIKVTLGRGKVQ